MSQSLSSLVSFLSCSRPDKLAVNLSVPTSFIQRHAIPKVSLSVVVHGGYPTRIDAAAVPSVPCDRRGYRSVHAEESVRTAAQRYSTRMSATAGSRARVVVGDVLGFNLGPGSVPASLREVTPGSPSWSMVRAVGSTGRLAQDGKGESCRGSFSTEM